jgi:imidazolonepropionase-like amidohydrolase
LKKLLPVFLCLIASLSFAQGKPATQQTKATPPPKITYIKAGRLFDSVGDSYRNNAVIVVENERIQKVGNAGEVQIPAGATVIDLSNDTVMPGLIDCHTHISSSGDRYDEIYTFKDSPFRGAFEAVVNARKTLDAGFTTIRNVGSEPFLAVDLRKWIDEGHAAGPRIVASGPAIGITGGHGDINSFSPTVHVSMYPEERGFAIADGVDQIRHTIRAQVKYGVDVIKIMSTGGVLSKGDQPGAPQYTLEEVKAAVDEAHMAGRKVASHAHGAVGIKNAIIAGVDSVEHASLVDDEGIRLAKEHGTYFVMDIYNDDYILGKAIEFGLPQENVDKERAVGRQQRENFEKAFKAGVKMAFGTDAGVYPHGDNAKQFYYMVKYGMSPTQAIKAATANAADLLGRSKDVGTIEAGKYADIIAVTGDPFKDIRALETMDFVMKGGHVYKQGGKSIY